MLLKEKKVNTNKEFSLSKSIRLLPNYRGEDEDFEMPKASSYSPGKG
jgi:hypothetical protein